MQKMYGLDLSKHNGSVNFSSIKEAGNDFVILRAGYGTSTEDPQFDSYYQQAKKIGLKVGVYWYSYALNSQQAEQEAKKCLDVIKNKKLEYPVFIDMEDADGYKAKNGMPSKATLVDICNVFCKKVEAQKYYVGIYASESWFDNQLKGLTTGRFDKWVANWGSNNGKLQSDKSDEYRLHQFTSKYKLDEKRFDRNISYYDYPSVIKTKGLNGFSQNSNNSDERPDQGSSDKLFEIGDKIKIKKGAKDLNNNKEFANFVYQKTYVVISYTNQRLVFGKNKNAVTGVIKPAYAIKVSSQAAYYPKVSIFQFSLVDGLKKIKVDASLENRKKIAKVNGIANYSGKASENIKLLNLLKKGKLLKV